MTEIGTALARFPADDDDDVLVAVLARIEKGELVLAASEAARVAGYLGHARKAVRRHASGALAAAIRSGSIGPECCEALLASDDAATRWGAAFALSKSGTARAEAVEVALATLEADDGDVRWAAAAIVVAAARESPQLRMRLRTLTTGGAATTRKMALLCLCDSGERDTEIYLRALGDRDALVRLAALTALGRIGDSSAPPLAAVSAVADADTEATVRRAAVAILRRLAPKDRPG